MHPFSLSGNRVSLVFCCFTFQLPLSGFVHRITPFQSSLANIIAQLVKGIMGNFAPCIFLIIYNGTTAVWLARFLAGF